MCLNRDRVVLSSGQVIDLETLCTITELDGKRDVLSNSDSHVATSPFNNAIAYQFVSGFLNVFDLRVGNEQMGISSCPTMAYVDLADDRGRQQYFAPAKPRPRSEHTIWLALSDFQEIDLRMTKKPCRKLDLSGIQNRQSDCILLDPVEGRALCLWPNTAQPSTALRWDLTSTAEPRFAVHHMPSHLAMDSASLSETQLVAFPKSIQSFSEVEILIFDIV